MSREAVLPINNSYLWVSHAFTFCCHRSCQKCSAFACLSYFHGEKRKNLNGLGLGHKITREGKFGLCESVLPLQLFPAPPVAAPPGPNTQINSASLASAAFVCTCAALHISYFPLLDTAFSPTSTSANSYPWFCLPLALLAFALLAITSHTLPSGHIDAPASDQMRRSQTTKHWIVTRLGRRDFCIQIKRSSLSILAKHYFGLMQTFNWGITCITREFCIHCIVLFFILYLVLNSGLRSEHCYAKPTRLYIFIKLSWDKYWFAALITMRSSQRNHLVRLKVKDFLLRL